jgi:predicted KAP-like P-loop ATPase
MANERTLFTFQGENGRDEFRREQIADKVISLLTSDIDISPMVIDGHWGTGKTEFCHKLMGKFEAEHEHYRLLYIDAFQADHADNPLLTILAEVLSLLPDGEQKQSLREKIIPVVRYGIKTTLKAGVSHLLRENADKIGEDLDQYLQEAADKAIDASVMAMLQDHEEAQRNLKALQSVLAKVAEDNPIVIFIDELDRCRPDYSVQMLEVIKHTFHVNNVKFVLITNTAQLRAAINHSYGPLVDAQRYLDKFLKFSFCLPNVIPSNSSEKTLASVEHFNNLVSVSPILKDTDLNDFNNGVHRFTTTLISHNQLSLRETETFIRYLEIFHTLSNGMATNIIFGHTLLRVLGVFIFCFRTDIAAAVQSNNVDAKQIAAVLGLKSIDTLEKASRYPLHSEVIAALLTPACTSNADAYKPNTEELQKAIQDYERSYFKNWGLRQGQEFQSVINAIDVLNLGGRL